MSDDFLAFRRKFFRWGVKTASYLFIGSSWWEKDFDEKILMFFNQFETFSEKVLAVCRELFVGLLQFESTCSKIFNLRKKICSKISFFRHLGQRSKNYRTSSSNFRRSCQNCILRVHKNILTKTAFFLGKISTFVVIGPSAELFLNSIEIYGRGFEKCNLRVHLKILSEKFFCGNSSVLFIFFWPWAKAKWPFVGKLLAGLLNCILSFDAIVFAKNVLFGKEVYLF